MRRVVDPMLERMLAGARSQTRFWQAQAGGLRNLAPVFGDLGRTKLAGALDRFLSAWQGRVVTGFHDVINAESSRPILKPKKEIRYNLQYFRYIRPGAVRIAAEADEPHRLDPLAFINTDGTYVVVILAKSASDILLRGLPSGEYKVSFAIEGGSAMIPDTFKVGEGGVLETRMPGPGVITISGS